MLAGCGYNTLRRERNWHFPPSRLRTFRRCWRSCTVTPPVALAAFAAAPIAGTKPMETGFEAVRLAIAGFIAVLVLDKLTSDG